MDESTHSQSRKPVRQRIDTGLSSHITHTDCQPSRLTRPLVRPLVRPVRRPATGQEMKPASFGESRAAVVPPSTPRHRHAEVLHLGGAEFLGAAVVG